MTRIYKGVIYLIRNKINGMKYIGQTTQKPEKRFYDHFNPNRKDSILLSRAGQKYGKSAFELIIIEDNVIGKDVLNSLEKFYIGLYDTVTPNGYNIAIGGADTFSQPKLNPEQEKEAIALYASGLSMKEIGKRFGRDKKAIKGALVRNDIISRPTKTKYLGITKNDLVILINQGMSSSEIAKYYDVVPSNISYYIKKYDLKILIENRKKTVNAEM